MVKVDKKIVKKEYSKQLQKADYNKKKGGPYKKHWNAPTGRRKNHKNRPKHGKNGRRPGGKWGRSKYPPLSPFGHWKDPNPRTKKEEKSKKVRRLRLTGKALRVSRIVRRRFRLRKGMFVLYKYGMHRFFRKVQFYRKTNNFLVFKKTANNFFITAFKRSGRMLFYISAGMLNLKGPRRSTTEAAERVVSAVYKRLRKGKIKNIGLVIKSPNGRIMKSAIRRLDRLYRRELNTLVLFMIPRSHNGVRGKKIKRG